MADYVPDDKTRASVKAMAAYGIDHAGISAFLSISPADLLQHYTRDVAAGRAEAEVTVRKRLYEQAIAGDPIAMKVWLEQNAGGF